MVIDKKQLQFQKKVILDEIKEQLDLLDSIDKEHSAIQTISKRKRRIMMRSGESNR